MEKDKAVTTLIAFTIAADEILTAGTKTALKMAIKDIG